MIRVPNSVARRLLLATTLAIGAGTLWFFLAILCGDALLDATVGMRGNWPAREDIIVTSEGVVLIRSTPRGRPHDAEVRELNGRPRPDLTEASLKEGVALWTGAPDAGPLARDPDWGTRLKPFVDERRPGDVWYFVHDGRYDGAGYFAGYRRPDNQRIGFIGLSGFSKGPTAAADWIPVRRSLVQYVPYWSCGRISINRGYVQRDAPAIPVFPTSWVFVPSANHVRLVDLGQSTIRTVFETSEPIESLAQLPVPSDRPAELSPPPALLIRTKRKVHALNRDFRIARTFDVPGEFTNDRVLTWYELDNGQAVAEFMRAWRTSDGRNVAPRVLFRIAADGTPIDRVETALQSGMPKWESQREASLLPWALPAPAVLPGVEAWMIRLIDQVDYAVAMRTWLTASWRTLSVVTALASVLAALAWRRATLAALPGHERAAWATFVFLLGIPGYAGFRLHRRWPRREKCRRCGVRTPLDRTWCTACGQPFPEPALQGIELFARDPDQAMRQASTAGLP